MGVPPQSSDWVQVSLGRCGGSVLISCLPIPATFGHLGDLGVGWCDVDSNDTLWSGPMASSDFNGDPILILSRKDVQQIVARVLNSEHETDFYPKVWNKLIKFLRETTDDTPT